MLSPLTFSPKANTASPAAKMLRAAFTSRSWIVPHSGHIHDRTSSSNLSLRSISTYVLPAQSALYASWRVNSPQLVSVIGLASFGFLIRFFTARFSAQTTWFSFSKGEGAISEFSRLAVFFGLEGRVFRSTFKKILERGLLVPQALLQGNAGHIVQKSELR